MLAWYREVEAEDWDMPAKVKAKYRTASIVRGMAAIKAIRTEADYEAALARIDTLMNAEPGSQEGSELDVLADLVEHYESKHEPMGHPSLAGAIIFRLEQAGLDERDLVPLIGSPAKVSDLLAGKRGLTMSMARALHEHLGIPAEVLIRSTSGLTQSLGALG